MSKSAVIRLSVTADGHYLMPIHFENEDSGVYVGQMIVDTGSTTTVFDQSALEDFLPHIPVVKDGPPLVFEGVGGSVFSAGVIDVDLTIAGCFTLEQQLYPVVECVGEPHTLGIIGMDVLGQFESFVLSPNTKTLNLTYAG
jgi:hypothetical protein